MQNGKTPANGLDPAENGELHPRPRGRRTKVVVVGLGMVGIAFM